jgi:hypothetical protein
MMKLLCVSIALCCAGILGGCGGSSDHGNGYATITGKVEKTDGDPAGATKILLLPNTLNYAVDSSSAVRYEAVADSLGFFVIDSVPYGDYCISGHDDWSQGKFAKKHLTVDGGQEIIDCGELRLSLPGAVYFNADSLGLSEGMVLYFPGLPLFLRVDSLKEKWIYGVPAGVVELMGYDPVKGISVDLGIEYRSLEILAGRSIFIPYRLEKPWCIVDSTTAAQELFGYTGATYRFRVAAPGVKPEGDLFRFTWGNGVESSWSASPQAEYRWTKPGIYYVQAQMMTGDTYLAWSEAITVSIVDKNESE